MQLTSRLDIIRLMSGKRMVGSTAILQTRAVMKLACLVPQPLLSSNHYTTNLLDFKRKHSKQTSINAFFNVQFLPLKMAEMP